LARKQRSKRSAGETESLKSPTKKGPASKRTAGDEGLESKDPFLVDYKEKLRAIVEGLRGIGSKQLELLVVEMIRGRWIKDRRASYPYEVAWVFGRDDGIMSRLLTRLEEQGEIEPAGVAPGKKGPVEPFKPRTLRKQKTK